MVTDDTRATAERLLKSAEFLIDSAARHGQTLAYCSLETLADARDVARAYLATVNVCRCIVLSEYGDGSKLVATCEFCARQPVGQPYAPPAPDLTPPRPPT